MKSRSQAFAFHKCNLYRLRRGAFLADAGRGLLGLTLFTLITLAGGEALLSLLSAAVNDGVVYDGVFAVPGTLLGEDEGTVAQVE